MEFCIEFKNLDLTALQENHPCEVARINVVSEWYNIMDLHIYLTWNAWRGEPAIYVQPARYTAGVDLFEFTLPPDYIVVFKIWFNTANGEVKVVAEDSQGNVLGSGSYTEPKNTEPWEPESWRTEILFHGESFFITAVDYLLIKFESDIVIKPGDAVSIVAEGDAGTWTAGKSYLVTLTFEDELGNRIIKSVSVQA